MTRAPAADFHDRILAAIRAGDPAGAEAAMRRHMQDTYAYIASFITVPVDERPVGQAQQGISASWT